MEPENPTPVPQNPVSGQETKTHAPRQAEFLLPPDPDGHGVTWVFMGPQGLRAGWSIVIFLAIFSVLAMGLNSAAHYVMLHFFHSKAGTGQMTANGTILSEGLAVLSLWIAARLMALIERRSVWDYNLNGPNRVRYFAQGLVAGFVALSVLVGSMAAGGWLHLGATTLNTAEMVKYAIAWAIAFLLVGCMEEGLARCYLLFTLGRGLNFWWGLGLVAFMCGLFSLNHKANGLWGAYSIALLGLIPCLILQMRNAPSTGFWCAAWVTSVFFGGGHTGNGGENWIGIFAAAAIGFVFCVSVYVTKCAWWAIGCHAAWDWGETYFYGTADSGMKATGNLLTATPMGNVLWSGGTDGPEGSLLVLAVILLLLIAVVAIYRRRTNKLEPVRAAEQVAG
ncbi:MAG: type II CAAX prenyl endopeptidase Rce1 family protein [Acidobacteriota bacterium]